MKNGRSISSAQNRERRMEVVIISYLSRCIMHHLWGYLTSSTYILQKHVVPVCKTHSIENFPHAKRPPSFPIREPPRHSACSLARTMQQEPSIHAQMSVLLSFAFPHHKTKPFIFTLAFPVTPWIVLEGKLEGRRSHDVKYLPFGPEPLPGDESRGN